MIYSIPISYNNIENLPLNLSYLYRPVHLLPNNMPILPVPNSQNYINLHLDIQHSSANQILNATQIEEEKKAVSSPEKRIKDLIKGTCYESRNVFKALIGYMQAHIRKQRHSLLTLLTIKGYTQRELEHAFFKIDAYSGPTFELSKSPYRFVSKMIIKKSIYTYILRETLIGKLAKWESGIYGKISKKNIEFYKNVCKKIYDEAIKVISQ